MSAKAHTTPIFLALIDEAEQALEATKRSKVTRAEALEAIDAARKELAAELAGKVALRADDAEAIVAAEAPEEIEIDVDEPTIELQPRSTSVLELQLAAPLALPNDWDDGPWESEELRIEPPFVANL